MAAEAQAPAPAAAEASKEQVVITTETTNEEQPPPAPARRGEDLKEVLAKEVAEEAKEDAAVAAAIAAEQEEEAKKEPPEPVVVQQSASFKEETNVVEDLIDPHKKALDELKQLVAAALANHEFTKPPPREEEKKAEEEKKDEEVKKAEEPEKEEATSVAEEEPNKGAVEEEPKKVEEESKKEAAEEPTKPEEKPAVEVQDKEVIKEAVVVEEPPSEEKKLEPPVDDDGAKTVEAIAETVVPASSTATPPPPTTEETVPPTAEEKPAAEAEAEAAEEEEEAEKQPPTEPEEVFLWGIPLLGDERSDTVLLKFLRARDYKPKEALAMIKNTVLWRKEFGTDGLLDEELGVTGLDKAVFTSGFDKEGHPVCYNTYGEFQDKELYQSAFGDEEKRKKFLRWRVQFLEKGIREQLDFTPTGVCTMVQVNDLKDAPWVQKKELRVATKQAVDLLQDNYPEFVHKQIFIDVPWWYLAFNRMISPFLTQRTKSKMVFAGPSKSAETLFKYIAPEQVPIQFGGLKKEDDPDFSTSDAVTEVTIKPSSKHTIDIPTPETSTVLVWELRVLGGDVSYGAEFVPAAEGGYTVIVQKSRKLLVASDEPVEKNSFKVGEPGKIVLTVDNTSSKKKKLLYRYKSKSD